VVSNHISRTANQLREMTESRHMAFSAIAEIICEPMLDRIEELEKTVVEAIAELRAEHRPEGNPGKEPWGCVVCYPADSSWPCVSRMIADDLAALLPDPEEATL